MKNIVLSSITVALLSLPLGACSSTVAKRAQRSDGLLDFLFGNSVEVAVPVEKISGGGGRIASAHVKTYGKKVYVSGLVQRQSLADPPPWAHVDVIVVDAQQKVIEGVAVNYMPRDIPHGYRGGFSQSHYTARLTVLPQTGATVKVVFHGTAKSECEFERKS